MNSVTHASTISLTPHEVGQILVAALNLPANTEISFKVNQYADATKLYSTHFCSGVILTFREEREIIKLEDTKFSR